LLYSRLDSVRSENTVNVSVPPLSARGKSVKDDWRAWLPEEKAQVFHKQVHELESSYAMLSVSLDEAIELRQLGEPGNLCSRRHNFGPLQAADPDARRLASRLVRTRQAYGTIPNAAPLDPANFQGQRGQRSARMNSLLNHVLLPIGSSFFKR